MNDAENDFATNIPCDEQGRIPKDQWRKSNESNPNDKPRHEKNDRNSFSHTSRGTWNPNEDRRRYQRDRPRPHGRNINETNHSRYREPFPMDRRYPYDYNRGRNPRDGPPRRRYPGRNIDMRDRARIDRGPRYHDARRPPYSHPRPNRDYYQRHPREHDSRNRMVPFPIGAPTHNPYSFGDRHVNRRIPSYYERNNRPADEQRRNSSSEHRKRSDMEHENNDKDDENNTNQRKKVKWSQDPNPK